MPLPNINKKVFDDIFRRCSEVALVTLRSAKSKTTNYDPYRETGYAETYQNAIPVKILKKALSPSSLSYNEIGLVKSGALQIILSNADVELIKNSEQIKIGDNYYYVYEEAIGNKFLVYDTQFANYSKIIIFLKDA